LPKIFCTGFLYFLPKVKSVYTQRKHKKRGQRLTDSCCPTGKELSAQASMLIPIHARNQATQGIVRPLLPAQRQLPQIELICDAQRDEPALPGRIAHFSGIAVDRFEPPEYTAKRERVSGSPAAIPYGGPALNGGALFLI
jgi:hypothetical protein